MKRVAVERQKKEYNQYLHNQTKEKVAIKAQDGKLSGIEAMMALGEPARPQYSNSMTLSNPKRAERSHYVQDSSITNIRSLKPISTRLENNHK